METSAPFPSYLELLRSFAATFEEKIVIALKYIQLVNIFIMTFANFVVSILSEQYRTAGKLHYH